MMRNVQSQINSLKGEFKNEIQNIMKTQQTVLMEQQNAFQNMLSGFFQNQSSTSGTFPSNTIPNPKGEMKAITTRSRNAYEGPSIPTPKKVVEREPMTQWIRSKQISKEVPLISNLRLFPFGNSIFADALLLMPKFASTIKSLLANKDKLFELAKIPLNDNCSAMLLKKLLEKLGDLGKFLIPCDFPGLDVCHALADLGTSLNITPLSIWKKLSLPELTPTRMNLELAYRSITLPKGVAEDVFVRVGKFHFSTDFVVVDYKFDPRVPFILGRSFLRTGHALIDVYGEEITLRVNDEAVNFNLNQTTRYGNPTLTSEPIISDSFPSLTPFEGSNFILEEIEAYLKDESISPVIDHADYDSKGDICLIKKLLNDDPFQLPPMDLKQGEIARPMTHLLEKETPFVFSKDCIDAFETLKKKLTDASILVVPDWNLPFELICDASDFTIGAVLGQRKTKHFQPIHYASKTMTEAQIHYTTTEKEMLAVVYAYEKFRPYLVLSKSIVYTDHSALKYLLSKQDAKPRAIISDRRTHFCNDKFSKVMSKYGVTHRLAITYCPQISGQVEVSNRGLKRILERTVGENLSLWKILLLTIELEHKAYWALKHANFNLKTAGDHQKLQLHEHNELRDQAYENSLIYKEKTKKLHDSKIKNRIFNVGDRVLLFNSHLKIFSGKLKTRCSRPFTITRVFPYGTVELSQPEGPNFNVNGHRVKHYFGGDVP
nr:reverse transcriptase domain-containing protein [Tanacetum cinerariifolium]